MPASIVVAPPAVDELEESELVPMTDREHLSAFGWAWDDPNTIEATS